MSESTSQPRTLYRLQEDGKRLVGDSFMRGETELEDDTVAEYLEPLPSEQTVDFHTLDAKVDTVKREYDSEHEQKKTAIDRDLAETVHRELELSRRVAADPGLWHWLAVVRYPDLVRHRWTYRSEVAMREKFLGAGSDLYSNAIHRLWWIAELTHDGDDYELTERVFDHQTLVNKVFDRWFARYRPAVIPVCDVLADEPSSVIDDATRQFNHALTTVQLEGLNRADARDLIERIVADVK